MLSVHEGHMTHQIEKLVTRPGGKGGNYDTAMSRLSGK